MTAWSGRSPSRTWRTPSSGDAITQAAADTNLLIAEAYYQDKNIPYHPRLADINAHRERITARRVILTHKSDDVLRRAPDTDRNPFEHAHDGLAIRL